jgi:hypothetical protein
MRLSDVRGLSRLAVDATTEVTSIVEAVHQTVLDVPLLRGVPLRDPVVTTTRFVYRGIRGITHAMGSFVDVLLGAPASLDDGPSTAARDATLAVLNGLVGDYLQATGHPFALPMRVQHNGDWLPPDNGALRAVEPRVGGRLMLLVHGLCMGPAQWTRGGQDRAADLARALGYTPLHLQYNSGLHVSINGRALAELLDALVQAWPVPLEEIAIIGHSMGGLVARSALHYGSSAGHRWRNTRVTVIFLGTPHHGAPLERFGHDLHRVLGMSGFTAPFARLCRMRSAGITDLRHGSVLDEDWHGRCRFADARHEVRRFTLLPRDVRAFAVAGSRSHGPVRDGGRLAGDGLVPVASALGHHADPSRALALAPLQQWVAHGTGHQDLVSNPAVFRRIDEWLQSPR